jgi:hypothetical protein
MAILKSLVTVVPDDSIIITIGDNHQIDIPPYYVESLNSLIPDKNRKLMKKKLAGKVFSFQTLQNWSNWKYAIELKFSSRQERISQGRGKHPIVKTIQYSKFNFLPYSPLNFNLSDIIFYPYGSASPSTYGDWTREIIKVIGGFSRKFS